jgi:hypothetical protein
VIPVAPPPEATNGEVGVVPKALRWRCGCTGAAFGIAS